MTAWTRQIPFRVDVAGIIEIMGSSLYSRPDTPVRELIQNANDAITRRRQRELKYQGRIDIVQDAEARTLTFHDDGIGLSAAEAEEYLSTLGIGITGLIKKGLAGSAGGDAGGLIGQFGIGMFSAFMLAERVVVESRRYDGAEPVRWEAGAGTDITLSQGSREEAGSSITLHLKPDHQILAQEPELLEKSIREFADFLTVPIFLNGGKQRVNVIQAAWFDPTPDRESIEMELESYFGETPLDVIPLRQEKPVSIAGALYITPQRVPGFAGEAVLTVTVRRMVISRRIQGLLPSWASFVRGVLELNDCAPTASREDLVRDLRFQSVRQSIEDVLFQHIEDLARSDPPKFEALVAWHRYTLAGAALDQPRLRDLLRRNYKLPTSKGSLTFDEILRQSPADPLFESDAERVVWYNTDRRQEAWMNTLFAGQDVPCVHALRSFEESLLGAWSADMGDTALRTASPGSPRFAEVILGAHDLHPAPDAWQEFLRATRAKIVCAGLTTGQPVMAFLNERYELQKTFDDLRTQGTIPEGFQRLIDTHFEQAPAGQNEVLLNTNHRLVARALEQKTVSPLASVLRLLVNNALSTAGASLPRDVQRQQVDDLDWIAAALWGRTT
ncbi:MAG: ATP-binding protein [Planctomycetota bacterium]|nr:ATP-binding protein [Planctomycetota bacterium]